MENDAPLATAASVSKDKVDKDLYDSDEQFVVGSIVSTYAHPFQANNANIVITAYNHFTPPLMVIIEKKYSIAKYNTETADREYNDQCKCVYYCTQTGSVIENWFKTDQLKVVGKGDLSFYVENKGKSLAALNTKIGEWAILSTVDLELGKKQTWLDERNPAKKSKVKSLLDFLPPLGSIIDFKLNEDYKKFNEKNGNTLHRKSKLLVKLRWWNNHSAKYSEEYFPMVALRLINKDDLLIKEFSRIFLKKTEVISLEKSSITTKSALYKLEEIVWKHYYYVYKFQNLFTNEIVTFKKENTVDITEIADLDPKYIDIVVNRISDDTVPALNYFDSSDKESRIHKWYKIDYLDKMNRFSQRIIYVNDLIIEDHLLPSLEPQKAKIIKANCLLRKGKIRHFNVSRILNYKELPKEFVSYFISN